MDANIHEIYNLLFSGEILRIPFSTEAEAEVLRVKLYIHKRLQDMVLSGAGIIDKTQILSFKLQANLPELDLPSYEATIFLRDREVEKKYSIQIVKKESGLDEADA